MSTPAADRPRVVIRSAQDVTNAINQGLARGRNTRAITFIALGGIFIDAYDFTAISSGLPDITKAFRLSPLAEGIVGASIMIGALVGALIGGHLVDRLGRYKVFMADMLFFVVSALVCAAAPNVEILTSGRFLMGFGIGMDFPVALAFIAEFTALRGKGARVTLWQPVWYIATTSGFLILLPLYLLLPASAAGNLWRVAVGFGAVPALAVMLIRQRYMNESPAWAATQGDLNRAAAILSRSYHVDAVADPDATRQPSTGPRASVRDFTTLFSHRYAPRTILAAIVNACQAAQYYAVGFALPVIITALLAQGKLTSIAGSLIFNLIFGVTGGFAGAWLAGRWGSWRLSTAGFTVCLVAALGLGALGRPSAAAPLTLVGVLLGAFMFTHAAGPGAQGMTMATLSYPTELRGAGSGFSQAMLRVGSTVSLLLFPILSKHLGTTVFFVVALMPALGLLTLLLIRWEPIGVDVDTDTTQTEADQTAAPASAKPTGGESP
jgi:predicted MFS family arabinose efflux permease